MIRAVAGLALAVHAAAAAAQGADDPVPPLRPPDPFHRNGDEARVEFYRELRVELVSISSDLSIELPHDLAVDSIRVPVSLGTPKDGLAFDRIHARPLVGWTLAFDLTLARAVFEIREGSSSTTAFTVSNPTAGGPDAPGRLDWSLRDVHLGVDRPLLIVQARPLGLMLHAGFGFCNVSAKPSPSGYEQDAPPAFAGRVSGTRREFLDGYARAGLAFSLPIGGAVTLAGDLVSERYAREVRGGATILNFGLMVGF